MSLFEAREWWTVAPDGAGDDAMRVSRRAMVVANVDNQVPVQDKIVVGTLDGRVRIYCPTQRDYRIEDLVAEMDMGKPILQISAGQFLSIKSGLALAILHLRSLVVYEVIPVGGFGQGSRYYSLQLQYEHMLEAPAHSFVYGQFGGYDKDSICVQSMDGRLSFFEQNAVSFSCALPNILLPIPFAYVSRSDSFVFVNSEMTCESYSYQALGSAHAFNSKSPGSQQLQRTWGCHIGQHAVDILIARLTELSGPSHSDIIIIGEKSLIALKSQGEISMSKTLSEVNPSCVTSYIPGSSNEVGARRNIIIGTHQKILMVFRDTQLLWTARVKAVPISIAVTTMGSIPGMIAVMFQSGEIQICYLGTDPSTIARPPVNSDDMNYSAVTEQYRNLQKQIRQMQNQGVVEPENRPIFSFEHKVKMDSLMSKSAFAMQPGNDIAIDSTGSPICALVNLRICYERDDPIDSLFVCINPGPGFIVETNTLCIKDFGRTGCKSSQLQIRIFASKSILPVEQNIKVSASFSNSENQLRVSFVVIPLPFQMLGNIVPPIRNSQCFLTIDTNRPAPGSLKELFTFLDSSDNPNVISVRYHCRSTDCTIILSKNAGRYRIQSSEFCGLSLLTTELITRLRWYWSLDGELQSQCNKSNGPLRISLDGDLPLEEFWTLVDSHLKSRNVISENSVRMDKLSQQLRAIQKRLLSRFRDATPSSLSNLDLLLRETLDDLIKIADSTRNLEENVKKTGHDISCCLSLISNLLVEICQMDNDNATCLRAYFNPILDDGIDQGFEERLDAGIAFLLSTTLAKEDKSQPIQLTSDLSIPTDTKKLRKHLKIVIDRLLKGMNIYKEESIMKKRNGPKRNNSENNQRS